MLSADKFGFDQRSFLEPPVVASDSATACYTGLATRVTGPLAAAGVEVWLVGADGTVTAVAPQSTS